MKSLIILMSIHQKNTEKVAKVIAEVINADILTPKEVNLDDIEKFDLIGFGSGIYSAKHHKSILNLVDSIQTNVDKKVFIFSTDGAPRKFFTKEMEKKSMHSNHLSLREKLLVKGFTIIGEFNCAGYNRNSFIKIIGGINKGRPNADDFQKAKEFALGLIEASN